MKQLQVLILILTIAGTAFAGDGPVTPEIGVDGPTIVGAIGLLSGVLVVMRARRK